VSQVPCGGGRGQAGCEDGHQRAGVRGPPPCPAPLAPGCAAAPTPQPHAGSPQSSSQRGARGGSLLISCPHPHEFSYNPVLAAPDLVPTLLYGNGAAGDEQSGSLAGPGGAQRAAGGARGQAHSHHRGCQHGTGRLARNTSLSPPRPP